MQRLGREHSQTCGLTGRDKDCHTFRTRTTEIMAEIKRHQAKPKVLEEIFWGHVQFEFDLWSHNIGIRQGGKVVTLAISQQRDPMSIMMNGGLGAMLAGDGLGGGGHVGLEQLLSELLGGEPGGLRGIPVTVVRTRRSRKPATGGDGGGSNSVPDAFPEFAIHGASNGGTGRTRGH